MIDHLLSLYNPSFALAFFCLIAPAMGGFVGANQVRIERNLTNLYNTCTSSNFSLSCEYTRLQKWCSELEAKDLEVRKAHDLLTKHVINDGAKMATIQMLQGIQRILADNTKLIQDL